MFLEIALVVFLTLVNGVLSMSELAVVSARPQRLKLLADRGSRGARIALRLQENPGRFLSAVQIGITLVGILAGAVSGATLGARLTAWLSDAGLPMRFAGPVGVGGVVAGITYLSLVVGELVPKQIALKRAESVAVRMAPAMAVIAKVTTPMVWLLDMSGRAVLSLLGQSGASQREITDEEVKLTIAEAQSAGVLAPDESEMIAGVMRTADRSVRALMTPRRDLDIVDLSRGLPAARALALKTRHSRLPAQDGGPDDIVGVISVRDILAHSPAAGPLSGLVQQAPVVMDISNAMALIQRMRLEAVHLILVYDEHGHFEGIVTAMDLLEAITGSLADDSGDEPAITQRSDGSWFVAGWMPADEFADRIGLTLPADGDFQTVAGFALDQLRRIPAPGDHFEHDGFIIEVADLDGMRIDQLLVRRKN
jgi:putative hemolysin